MKTIRRASAGGPSRPAAALERLIAELSAAVTELGIPAAQARIHHAFEQLLALFQLDRVALWELSEDRSALLLLHSRHSRGTGAPPPRAEMSPPDWMARRLLRSQPIAVRRLKELPKAAGRMKKYMLAQGLRACLILPLHSGGVVFGSLVFACTQPRPHWYPRVVAQLQIVADIFGNALARQRAEQARNRTELLEASILNSLLSRVAVIDRGGMVIARNTKWAEFVSCGGGSKTRVGLGANYLEICSSGKLCMPAAETRRGLENVLTGARQLFEIEYPCPESEGQRWYHMSVVPLTGQAGGGAVILHTDITDRKRAEAELKQSEERFRELADELPILMWMREPGKDVIHVNRFALEMTGWKPADFTLTQWLAAIHPDDLKQHWQTFVDAEAARKKYTLDYRYRHASGEYRWLLDCGVPRYHADGSFAGYVGIALDIHARKEAERERFRLAGKLLQAQEEERSRIARELHDDIAQRLALLAIWMQKLENPTSIAEADHGVSELRREAMQLSLDVGSLSHQLHSSYLEHLGLAAAVENQCKEFSAAHHVQIRCTIEDFACAPARDVSLGLFRVLQEALRNALRHSHAECVQVTLSAGTAGLRLQVADNGIGFDPQAMSGCEGLGLASMRERLRLLGGELSIFSAPGGGTRLEACIPQSANKRAASERFERLSPVGQTD